MIQDSNITFVAR